jgi:hypothetical protein
MTPAQSSLTSFEKLLEQIRANPHCPVRKKVEAAEAFAEVLTRWLGTPWSFTSKGAIDPDWPRPWTFDHVFWYRSVGERLKGTWANRIAVAHPYVSCLDVLPMGQPRPVERSSSAPAHAPSVVEINIGPDLSWWCPGKTTAIAFGSPSNLARICLQGA